LVDQPGLLEPPKLKKREWADAPEAGTAGSQR
jgi:hypothetical protein